MIAYLVSLLLWLVPLQTSTLHVYILYDKNHDGVEEGVGPGVPVYVGKSSYEVLNFTDFDSHAAYLITLPGFYFIRSTPKPTRPFFTWLCGETVDIDEPVEYVTVHCEEKFTFRLPFLSD